MTVGQGRTLGAECMMARRTSLVTFGLVWAGLLAPALAGRDLYARALAQISLLESGRVRYKAIDSGYCTASVSNCIHALSSLAQGHRRHAATLLFGDAASYLVLCLLAPWVIDCSRT